MSLLISPATYTPVAPSSISYSPGTQYSGNLLTTAKNIVATAEAQGLANADCHCTFTLPMPTDSRLVVNCLTAYLEVYVNSLSGGTLHCSIYVDVQDTSHAFLSNSTWGLSNTGDLNGQNNHVLPMDFLFSVLTDGNPHTFYLFFFVDSGQTANIGGSGGNVQIGSYGVGVGSNFDPAMFIKINGLLTTTYNLSTLNETSGFYQGQLSSWPYQVSPLNPISASGAFTAMLSNGMTVCFNNWNGSGLGAGVCLSSIQISVQDGTGS